MLSLLSTGVALWLIYGLLKGDWVIIAANAATLALVGILAILKLREHGRKKARSAPAE